MKIIQFLAVTSTKISANDVGIPKLDANTVLSNTLNAVYLVAGIVAVIAIIIAGYTYTTSNGNAASITKAKDTILYSVIGLIVIIMAFAITWFVIGRF
jgi:quinol-cytochrome oxidoreductase complex cytochrome b subunit